MKKCLIPFILCLSLFLVSCNSETDIYREALNQSFAASEEEDYPFLSHMVCMPPEGSSFDPAEFSSEALGLFSEDTGEVLYVKEPYKKVYPASMTKCMTLLLTLEKCKDLSDTFLITDKVFENLSADSSVAGLLSGYEYSIADLLTGLMVPSGNDAANALAIYISGSTEEFVNLMNERAISLGMMHTHFCNPHGLHNKNHYTCVYDFYLLLRTCMNTPGFLDYAGKKEGVVFAKKGSESIESSLRSTNSYLLGYTVLPKHLTLLGGKTGHTKEARRCLSILCADQKGNRYIGIVFGNSTYDGVYIEMNQLFEKVPDGQ